MKAIARLLFFSFAFASNLIAQTRPGENLDNLEDRKVLVSEYNSFFRFEFVTNSNDRVVIDVSRKLSTAGSETMRNVMTGHIITAALMEQKRTNGTVGKTAACKFTGARFNNCNLGTEITTNEFLNTKEDLVRSEKVDRLKAYRWLMANLLKWELPTFNAIFGGSAEAQIFTPDFEKTILLVTKEEKDTPFIEIFIAARAATMAAYYEYNRTKPKEQAQVARSFISTIESNTSTLYKIYALEHLKALFAEKDGAPFVQAVSAQIDIGGKLKELHEQAEKEKAAKILEQKKEETKASGTGELQPELKLLSAFEKNKEDYDNFLRANPWMDD